MDMLNSKAAYQLIAARLKPFIVSKKYRRTKSTFPCWYFEYEGGYISFWFQVARGGNELTVEFQYSKDPAPGTGKWDKRTRILHLLNETDVVKFKKHLSSLSSPADLWFRTDAETLCMLCDFVIDNFDNLLDRFLQRLEHATT